MKRSVAAGLLAVAMGGYLGDSVMPAPASSPRYDAPKPIAPSPKPPYVSVSLQSLPSGLETSLTMVLSDEAQRDMKRYTRVWYEIKELGVVVDSCLGAAPIRTISFPKPTQLDGCSLMIRGKDASGTHLLYSERLSQHGN